MDEILFKLLEQTPTIIALGVGLFALWKEKQKIQKEWLKEREQQMERIERLTTEHRTEVAELNTYVREREATHIETIKDLIIIIQEVEQNQEANMAKTDEIIKTLNKN